MPTLTPSDSIADRLLSRTLGPPPYLVLSEPSAQPRWTGYPGL